MHAITISEPGGPEVLQWTEVPDPELGRGEVIVEVAASAVNRADILQRRGYYPPPQGASEYPGLECSGTIVEVADDVDGWRVGDEVCALLSGGGYADKVAVPASQLLPVPAEVDLLAAAGLPEVACTVWSNVVMSAGLAEGEVILVHGGAGGVGTHAIQVATALGATVAVTTGDDARLERCRQLGADTMINYREQDFVTEIKNATGGANVILDVMGASYLDKNISALKPGGRLAIIGLQGGRNAELDLGKVLGKRASISATTLRARPIEEKAQIIAEVRKHLWPLVEQGTVTPVIHEVLPLTEAAEAHRALDEADIFGKVLLAAHS